jgi:predicted phosphodiesterase
VRVAALYDVHGNLPALDAVLADVEAAGVDAVVVGGDDVAGPWPAETLARLRELPWPAYWIRGNAEREALPGEEGNAPAAVTAFVRERLDEADVRALAALPLTVTLEVDGLGEVLFCHATPRNDHELRTAISPDERWAEVLAGVEQRVVVCGHTHVQFDRRVGDVRVVNAGAVGMAYEDGPCAAWALLGPDVELRVTPLDRDALAAAILRTPYPDAGRIAEMVRQPPAVAEVIADGERRVFSD